MSCIRLVEACFKRPLVLQPSRCVNAGDLYVHEIEFSLQDMMMPRKVVSHCERFFGSRFSP
jgi:hypothetical protein